MYFAWYKPLLPVAREVITFYKLFLSPQQISWLQQQNIYTTVAPGVIKMEENYWGF